MAEAPKGPQVPQPPGTPGSATAGSFSHMEEEYRDIEGQHGPRWALAVAALVLVGGSIGAYFYIRSERSVRLAPPVPIEGVLIEVTQPHNGATLDAAPPLFGWETVAGRDHYLFTLKLESGPTALIERNSKSSTLTLTKDDLKLLRSGSYIWVVRARTREGSVLGTGAGRFRIK